MKTKALLLAAAFAAAGAATSMAQVYSVNAVGYVNTTLKAGFNLVSNPLTAADNTIGKLFLNIQGGVPDGTTVYKFKNGNFLISKYDELDGFYSGSATAETTLPGEGVFVKIPGGTADKTVTFVGEVKQNTTTVSIPPGFSIISSPVPQALKFDAAKNTDGTTATFPVTDGDTVFQYDRGTANYKVFKYDSLDGFFTPALPVIPVGEAVFYLYRGTSTATWTRQFSVNNPS